MAKPIWITNYNLGILENLTPISIELIATPVTPAISVTYSIVSGSLPTGTSLSSTGLLSGIVTTTYTNNTYNFTTYELGVQKFEQLVQQREQEEQNRQRLAQLGYQTGVTSLSVQKTKKPKVKGKSA